MNQSQQQQQQQQQQHSLCVLLTEFSLATILLANLPGSPDPPAKCFVSVIVGFGM